MEFPQSSRVDEIPSNREAESSAIAVESPVANDAPSSFSSQLVGTPPAWAIELQAIFASRMSGLESMMQVISDQFEAVAKRTNEFRNVDASVSSQETSRTIAQSPVTSESQEWLCAMIGADLSKNPELFDSMCWIEKEILEENPKALAFVGQILVFRCAPAERKPSLLKDIGEAYYRCFPKKNDHRIPMEDALALWSKQQCVKAGLTNSVELVNPGERFDSARHLPVERGGVEVSEVLGWVVLREGGKVFSKASVQTR